MNERRRELQRYLYSKQFERRCFKVILILPLAIYLAYLAGLAFTQGVP